MGEKLKSLDADKFSPSALAASRFLSGRVIGQERGIRAITRATERINSPLRDRKKPIGSFLFLGPSRVGKTETARVLAQYLFGDHARLTHIDCTLFSSPHEVAKLKGSPPGYVGFREAGKEPRSPYPFFSRWNIYKYHHFHLADLHKNELEKMDKSEQDIADLEQSLQATLDEIRNNRDELKSVMERLATLKPKTARLKGLGELSNGQKKELESNEREIGELDKQANRRVANFEHLKNRWEKLRRELYEAETAAEPAFKEAFRKGWLYNPECPPDDLIAVVLFDEIEKADEALHDHIMEILDTGRCQLDNGETTPFQNAIIIMTSNVVQEEISRVLSENSTIGFHKTGPALSEKELDQKIYDIATEAVKKEFRPEFLNRIDEIVVYRPLTRGSMLKILDIRIYDLLADLREGGLWLRLKFDSAVKERLVDRAMKHSERGAGLLDKHLNKHVRDRLINLANTGQIKAGDTIAIKMSDKDGDEIVFYKEEK